MMKIVLIIVAAIFPALVGQELYAATLVEEALDSPQIEDTIFNETQWSVLDGEGYGTESCLASLFTDELVDPATLEFRFEGQGTLEFLVLKELPEGSDGTIEYELEGTFESIQGTEIKLNGWFLHRLEFPEGENFVSISLQPSEIHGRILVDRVFFESGGFGDIKHFGGTLEADLGREGFVEAKPLPGWEFLRWSGSRLSVEEPVTYIHPNETYVAEFQTEIQAFGHSWKMNGGEKRPWIYHGGKLTNEGGWLKTRIEGPAIVRLTVEDIPSSGGTYIQINPEAYIYVNGEHLVTIPKGVHDLAININGSASPFSITNFEVIYGLRLLEIETARGRVDIDEEREFYAWGERVKLEAVPEAGYRFAGWMGELNGSENPMVMDLFEETTFGAGFILDHRLEVADFSVEGYTPWIIDPFYSTPSGQPSYLFNQDWTSFKATVVGPAEIGFWANTDAGGSARDRGIGFYVNGNNLMQSLPSGGGEIYRFELEGGVHEIEWRMQVRNDLTKIWLGDLEVVRESNLKLTVLGNGIVSIIPNKEFYEVGEQVTLIAIPDDEGVFEGWLGDVESSDLEVEIVMDELTTIDASFSGSIDWKGAAWNHSGAVPVSIQNQTNEGEDDLGEGLIWKYEDGQPWTRRSTWIETEVEGPGVFKASVKGEDRLVNFKVLLNGESYYPEEYFYYSENNWEEIVVPCNLGSNIVRFEFEVETDSEVILDGFDFIQGYGVWTDVRGGVSNLTGDWSVFDAGSTASITATPDEEGLVFSGWFRDFESDLTSIELPMDRHYFIEGRYGTEHILGDITWLVSNNLEWELTDDRIFIDDPNLPDSEYGGWALARFAGPGILSFNHRNQGETNFYFDGVFSGDAGSSLSQWNSGTIRLPEVSQVVEVVGNGYSDMGFGNTSYSSQVFLEIGKKGIDGTNGGEFSLGSVVDLSMTLVEGNEFLGWSGDIKTEELSPQIVMDGHKSIVSLSRATTIGFGRDLRFSAGSNWYWETKNGVRSLRGEVPGGDEESRGLGYLELTIDGPGYLSFEMYHESGSGSDSIVSLDGQKVEWYRDYFDPVEVKSIFVPEGEHVVRWDAFLHPKSLYSLYLSNFNWVAGEHIEVTLWESDYVNWGDVELNPSSPPYQKGDAIVLTATPRSGFEFLYWIINGEYQYGNPLVLNPEEAIRVETAFGLMRDGVNYVASELAVVQDVIDLEVFNLEGDEVIAFSSNQIHPFGQAYLEGGFPGDHLLEFEYRNVSEGMWLAVSSPWGEKVFNDADEWKTGSIFVPHVEGESLVPVRFMLKGDWQPSRQSRSVWIKNIRLKDGSALPNVVNGVSLEYEPAVDYAELGETVTVSAILPEGVSLNSWTGDVSGIANPATMEIDESVDFGFDLSQTFEFGDLAWVAGGNAYWDTDYGQLRIYEKDYDGLLFMETVVSGPGVLEFRLELGDYHETSPTVCAVYLDDSLQARYEESSDVRIFVGEGDHRIRFEVEGTAGEKRYFTLPYIIWEAGWQVDLAAFDSLYRILGQKVSYETGDTITVLVESNDESIKFDSWEGDLAGEGPIVQLEIDRHIKSTARFRKSIWFRGHEWLTNAERGWGYDKNQNQLFSHAPHNTWIEEDPEIITAITGEGRVYVKWSTPYPLEEPTLEIWVDGELRARNVAEKENEQNEIYFDIEGEGDHEILIRNGILDESFGSFSSRFASGLILDFRFSRNSFDGSWVRFLSRNFGVYETRSLNVLAKNSDGDEDGMPLWLELINRTDPNNPDPGEMWGVMRLFADPLIEETRVEFGFDLDLLQENLKLESSRDMVSWSPLDVTIFSEYLIEDNEAIYYSIPLLKMIEQEGNFFRFEYPDL